MNIGFLFAMAVQTMMFVLMLAVLVAFARVIAWIVMYDPRKDK